MKKLKLIFILICSIFVLLLSSNVSAYSNNEEKYFKLDTVVNLGDYKIVVIKNNFNQNENIYYGEDNSCFLEITDGKDEYTKIALDSNNVASFGINSLVCLVKFKGDIKYIRLTDVLKVENEELPINQYGYMFNVEVYGYTNLNGTYVCLIILGLILSICLFLISKRSKTKFLDFIIYFNSFILSLSLMYYISHFMNLNFYLISQELNFLIILISNFLMILLVKSRKKKKKAYFYRNNHLNKTNVEDRSYLYSDNNIQSILINDLKKENESLENNDFNKLVREF